jgi:hypothetical protein
VLKYSGERILFGDIGIEERALRSGRASAWPRDMA